MNRVRIAPIVEGHGEVEAVPVLLRRIATERFPAVHVDVCHPIRVSRTKIIPYRAKGATDVWIGGPELERAAALAAAKLAVEPVAESLILLLLDADNECPASLVPRLLHAMPPRSACVIAKREYETWFVGAAPSLARYLDLRDAELPVNPEAQGCGKRWIEDRMRDRKYAESVHQARFSAAMDLDACAARCPSFAKLLRDLGRVLADPS